MSRRVGASGWLKRSSALTVNSPPGGTMLSESSARLSASCRSEGCPSAAAGASERPSAASSPSSAPSASRRRPSCSRVSPPKLRSRVPMSVPRKICRVMRSPQIIKPAAWSKPRPHIFCHPSAAHPHPAMPAPPPTPRHPPAPPLRHPRRKRGPPPPRKEVRHTRACRGYLAEHSTQAASASPRPPCAGWGRREEAWRAPHRDTRAPTSSYPRLPRVSRGVLDGVPRVLPARGRGGGKGLGAHHIEIPAPPLRPTRAKKSRPPRKKIRHTRACRGYLAEFCTGSRASAPRRVGEAGRGLVRTTSRYPRTHLVIPAPPPRHTRACRGYLAEFWTGSRVASLRVGGEAGRGLARTTSRYPRQARV